MVGTKLRECVGCESNIWLPFRESSIGQRSKVMKNFIQNLIKYKCEVLQLYRINPLQAVRCQQDTQQLFRRGFEESWWTSWILVGSILAIKKACYISKNEGIGSKEMFYCLFSTCYNASGVLSVQDTNILCWVQQKTIQVSREWRHVM